MNTSAVVAVQGKFGWEWAVIRFDGNAIGPLLARWYRDINKARHLVRHGYIESLRSDPALLGREQPQEPVMRKEDVYGRVMFCNNYYFLANKPKIQWIYSCGAHDKGPSPLRPEPISDNCVWVDVIRSKGTISIHLYFGEERMLEFGPRTSGKGDNALIYNVNDIGEKFFLLDSVTNLVDGKIDLCGRLRDKFERMLSCPLTRKLFS